MVALCSVHQVRFFFSFFVAVRTVRGGTCGILLALLVLSTVVEFVVRFDFFHKLFF